MLHRSDRAAHSAASAWLSHVAESVAHPARYFEGNTARSATLIRAAAERGVEALVYSSTAAVYGGTVPAPDSGTPTVQPINPYGASKRMVEQMLKWNARCGAMRGVSLRYFNVGGASFGVVRLTSPRPT